MSPKIRGVKSSNAPRHKIVSKNKLLKRPNKNYKKSIAYFIHFVKYFNICLILAKNNHCVDNFLYSIMYTKC